MEKAEGDNKVRIVLVDDQLLFVESLKTVLENLAEDFQVVGMASNGVEAIHCVEQFQPQVVLMDVRMPEMDGVEATRRIHDRFPDVQIMMLTTFDDDEYVGEALKYGAAGYLLKNIPPAELISSIRAMVSGAVAIHPSIAASLVKKAYQEPPKQAFSAESESLQWVAELNRREKEILSLLAEGYNNHEISERAFIAEQTVRNYVHRIYNKMGVNDRGKAIILAKKALASL